MLTLKILAELYYRYNRRTDDNIRKYLETIQIVKKEHKAIGSVYGYYPLSNEAMSKILEKPRNISTTFDANNTADRPILNLVPYKTVIYLVKSSSRFFLKPDIGEVFDQLPYDDLYSSKLKAICLNTEYEELEGTEGEHFIMSVDLLTEQV